VADIVEAYAFGDPGLCFGSAPGGLDGSDGLSPVVADVPAVGIFSLRVGLVPPQAFDIGRGQVLPPGRVAVL